MQNGRFAERVAWLERLIAATEAAIARLRELDDPADAVLVDDLQTFYDGLLAQREG